MIESIFDFYILAGGIVVLLIAGWRTADTHLGFIKRITEVLTDLEQRVEKLEKK